MGKSQFSNIFNWQTTSPITNFLPGPGPNQSVAGNSPLSGVTSGAASSTNTIYTNIIGMAQLDRNGIEINWTGTPTGTYQIMCSVSGINFYALSGFSPSLVQPTGSAGGNLIQVDQGFKYLFIQYTNSSGSGLLTAYCQNKAFNQ